MKKIALIFFAILVMVLLVACTGMSISTKRYDEISDFVLKNKDTILSKKEIEFFDYETTGLSIGGVYYGYYYTENNEVLVPDFYSGDNLGERYEDNGGTYFGKPNNGTDWCFVKEITHNWYYYELHWG
jgi:hypothetical protein